VTELRFHRSLYRGQAVVEATKVYAKLATCEELEDAEHWIVRVSATSPARELRVVRELANYALGLTIAQDPRR
jgi:hypothetical protein